MDYTFDSPSNNIPKETLYYGSNNPSKNILKAFIKRL